MAVRTTQHFETWQGDNDKLSFSLFDGSGAPLDITGATVRWVLFKRPGDVLTLIEKDNAGIGGITVTNLSGGLLEVLLLPADTALLSGNFRHELQVTHVSGDINTVTTGYVCIQKTTG